MTSTRTVVTIGNFDGVHRGHLELFRRARDSAGPAGAGGRVVALVFHPHPMTTLRPALAPPMLMTFARRAAIMRAHGVDEVVELTPTPEFLQVEARVFVEGVVREYAPVAFVEGEDFHFGRGRGGNVEALRRMGSEMDPGFAVEVVEPQSVDLSDQSIVVASSSIVRWLVQHGRVGDAARVLGRPYEMTGTVVQGDRRGRQIGFPTANLETPCLLPRDGVYAALATLPDGRVLPVALHVGERATFDDTRRTVEGYILDWAGPLAEGGAEYGWQVRYDVLAWIRGQVGFESVDQLVRQIEDDVRETRRIVERWERRRDPDIIIPETKRVTA
ncbi:MAG: bifunctional riboflavin kinase/FMN adenylyltransferase [Phycisphaerales bacterium]|nr:bifunctional riboflavin kinase/FMN adenylyltransferase [Phycisphaerales bacterium]